MLPQSYNSLASGNLFPLTTLGNFFTVEQKTEEFSISNGPLHAIHENHLMLSNLPSMVLCYSR